LFDRPAQISKGRGFTATVTSEALRLDALLRIIELTCGMGTPSTDRGSGLPRIVEKRPD